MLAEIYSQNKIVISIDETAISLSLPSKDVEFKNQKIKNISLIFTTPYSPKYNPIELFFNTIK